MSIKKQKAAVAALPVARGEEWVMERKSIDLNIAELGKDVVPDLLLCVLPEKELVIGSHVVPPEPDSSEIMAWALQCMLSPMAGDPRRPERITLAGGKLKQIQGELEQLGISVKATSFSHPFVDEVASMAESQLSKRSAPYLKGRKDDPEIVADFFRAAAEFHKAKPWEKFEFENPVKLELKSDKRTDYWAIVMGTGGEEFGVVLYRSGDDLLDLFDAESEEEAAEVAHRLWSIGFSFDDIEDVGSEARTECETHGWQLANGSVYPSIVLVDPKKGVHAEPSMGELTHLTAATRVLAKVLNAVPKEAIDGEEIVRETTSVDAARRNFSVTVTVPAPEFFDEEDDDYPPPYQAPARNTALDRANDLVHEAYDEDSKNKRVKAAKQALAISSDCVEAYLLLAEEAARDVAEEIALLEQAVQAGERVIGKDQFAELEGHFWQYLESRPYMRARLALADLRLREGDMERAIADYEDMLRLNPNDNLGARYTLYRCYLITDQDKKLHDILKTYDEPSGLTLYPQALAAYRQSPGSKKSDNALAKALETNPLVVDYLLERKPVPDEEPEMYGIGSREEAILCAQMFVDPWRATPGAVEWLGKTAESFVPKKAKSRSTKAPKRSEPDLDNEQGAMSTQAHMAMHTAVENQLAANDPPETKETLERLRASGMDRHEAIHAIASVLAEIVWEAANLKKPYDEDDYVRRLRKLR